MAGFARSLVPVSLVSLVLGCHAQQNFPGATHQPAAPAPQLQLFEPANAPPDAKDALADLSSLNAEPAGAHGFVRPSLGHFVDDRGSRLRFFGVNLSGIACLPERSSAAPLARHLRRLGFNAVRLHGLDAPGVLLGEDGQFLAESLQLLDHFTAALKAEGIYFSLSLHTSRSYPGLEGESKQRFPQGKVLDRFHPPFLDAQREFARRLLGHRNAETEHEYHAEPALLYVELSDEDTLFPSPAGSPDDLPAEFRAELAQGYAGFLAQRTAEGLRAPGPADEEAKAELPTFRGSAQARQDYAQYLRQIERDNVRSLLAFVRDELGLKSMLINSQASFGGLPGLLREAELSDFIDVHGVWTAAQGAQINALDAGILGRLASHRVFGKPFVVSAYAYEHSAYAAELFPLLIGIAGLQDWDAVFAFAYTDQTRAYRSARINGPFELSGNPAKLAFASSAAAAFRRGWVSAGASQNRIELSVPLEPSSLPYAEDAIASLWNERGVSLGVAAIEPLGITLRPGGGEVTASRGARVSGTLGSESGELLWEPQGRHARFSINAPSLAAVCGWVSDSLLEFGSVSLQFHGFSPGFACASLLALGGQPLDSAQRVLFSVSGLAQNSVRAQSNPPETVALAQYVPVTLTLPRGAWHAEALDSAGAPVHSVTVRDGRQFSTEVRGAALSYAFSR
ncbi:MAG TPA: hypothetical protein VFK05_25525 [Polyangiaceae bacterium]|nr:hypothetical protein [Polyangiaceae bacterium]